MVFRTGIALKLCQGIIEIWHFTAVKFVMAFRSGCFVTKF